MKKYFPFLDWMFNYKRADLSGDLTAGLTVGVMLIPQGMAYSMLAGLPPIYGLYASTIPLIIYALFGTSRQLAVGPVAMVALLISSGVGALAELGSTEFISLAILLALMVGMIQLSMGVFRLGFVVNFLSHPVIAGFTSAAALIIGFSQLKHLLGFKIEGGKVHELLVNVFQNLDKINYPTLTIGVLAIATLLIVKKVNRKIPGPLIVVLLGIAAVFGFNMAEVGVKIVKEVPSGLPVFGIPEWDMTSFKALLPTALTISFVGFMESIAVAKAIQSKHKNYEVVSNQELIGLGLANIVGSFFKAFPVTGGFSRTAVNDQAGAKTGLASIFSAVLIVITLLFLTPYFYYLPNAVLAAIIMVAVFGLIDFKEAKHLWQIDKRDFTLFMVTAVGTLFLGIEEGILIGAGLSLLMVIYQVSNPHIAELGKVPNSEQFRNINRFDDLIQDKEILVVRFDAQLYFANLSYFKENLQQMEAKKPQLKYVILDAKSISSLDSSAVHALHDLIEDYEQRGIKLYIANAIGPVRDILQKAHIVEALGAHRFHMRVIEAVNDIKGRQEAFDKTYTLQTNG
ncbi:MAG: solute carrier family 26 protein [Chitinophagales bacterium]